MDTVIERAHPYLQVLIEDGADGGYGEFEEYLPEQCKIETARFDATWLPELRWMCGHMYVTWRRVK